MARMDTLTSPADQGRPSTEAGQPMTADDGLANARSATRMFGMVAALVVQEQAAGSGPPIAAAARQAGSTAFACALPQLG
jgi:hypothetical protein